MAFFMKVWTAFVVTMLVAASLTREAAAINTRNDADGGTRKMLRIYGEVQMNKLEDAMKDVVTARNALISDSLFTFEDDNDDITEEFDLKGLEGIVFTTGADEMESDD
eukprot:TRINITY_DN23122_c0_g1_i1.p2 TRINITY_DN23122_c0_g1~~TRINITY_DN23122_c0_g1_i1.p2  ORF type:complete len:108 (+),score=29.04 TRINITY_DN23122_c0_g1_i1:241-564(+)